MTRVRATRSFSVYWNYQVWNLAKEEEVSGGLADHLLATDSPVEDLAPAEEPTPVEDPNAAPDGTIAEVIDWVGEDRERAALALKNEHAKGDKARSTLVAALDKLLSDN